MVASSNQPALFGFPSPSHPPSSHILTQLLTAIESQLAAPVSMPTVSMATELSLLMMVLVKRWSKSVTVCVCVCVCVSLFFTIQSHTAFYLVLKLAI